MDSIRITQLPFSRSKEYKTLFLEALQNDPQAFGSSYKEWSQFSDEKWQERPKNPNTIILTAEVKNKLVGMVAVYFDTTKQVAEIWGMYVNRSCRGKGIGKKLMQTLLKKIENNPRNAIKIKLMVNPEQESAVKLYESLGFQTVGRKEYTLGDGKRYNLFVMEKLFTKVFDGHNDSLTHVYLPERGKGRSFLKEDTNGQIDLPRAKKGNFAGGLFSIFTPPPYTSKERDPMYGLTITDNGYTVTERSPIEQQYAEEFSNSVMNFAYKLESESKNEIKIVKTYEELEQCLANNILAVILHFEGAEAIKENLSNLEYFYQKGLRSLGLVWSRPNAFGTGVPFIFPHHPDTGTGLTEAGKALVRKCNELGIIVDLAHINEKGFFDVAKISTKPLVVTHTDAYAICPSTRNITDEQIDAVGESGGVIGINFETMNTRPDGKLDDDTPLSVIVDHIDYIVKRIGINHVAFGSDFDGAEMPKELHDVTGLPLLIQALQKQGYDNESMEKIAYKNWLRILKDTWKR